VAWPKRAAGVPTDMTEDVVREVALPRGLVDNKVCAIDETWSGLRLVDGAGATTGLRGHVLVVATASIGSLTIAATVLREGEGEGEDEGRGTRDEGRALLVTLISFVAAAGVVGGAFVATDGRWHRTFVVTAIVAAAMTGGLGPPTPRKARGASSRTHHPRTD
jgi:hypothetical protein